MQAIEIGELERRKNQILPELRNILKEVLHKDLSVDNYTIQGKSSILPASKYHDFMREVRKFYDLGTVSRLRIRLCNAQNIDDLARIIAYNPGFVDEETRLEERQKRCNELAESVYAGL